MTTAIRTTTTSAYQRLRSDIPKEYFAEQKVQFAIILASRLIAFIAIIATLVWVALEVDSYFGSLVWAVLLGLAAGAALTQIALCAHDIGHRSALKGRVANNIAGIFLGNFLLGVSQTWWTKKHNQHHATPNRLDHDTDIDFPIIAFDIRQVAEKRKIFLPIIKNQHLLFLPLLSLQAINTQIGTVIYLVRQRPPRRALQLTAVTAHWLSIAALVYFTGTTGLVFVVFGLAAHGFCNGMIFAPNHKGMEIIEADAPVDRFRDQVVTARNVHGNGKTSQALVNFWYGGLNYQIEHHLFPEMPRGNLGKSTPIVQKHCEMNNASYVSVTPFKAIREFLGALRKVAMAARRGEHELVLRKAS